MKSFCIKTNNEEIIQYLLKNLEASSLENIYFVSKNFKSYKNVIIHYTGNARESFFKLFIRPFNRLYSFLLRTNSVKKMS